MSLPLSTSDRVATKAIDCPAILDRVSLSASGLDHRTPENARSTRGRRLKPTSQ